MIDFRVGHAEASDLFDGEIVVDLFAGGGGASMGIERALSPSSSWWLEATPGADPLMDENSWRSDIARSFARRNGL